MSRRPSKDLMVGVLPRRRVSFFRRGNPFACALSTKPAACWVGGNATAGGNNDPLTDVAAARAAEFAPQRRSAEQWHADWATNTVQGLGMSLPNHHKAMARQDINAHLLAADDDAGAQAEGGQRPSYLSPLSSWECRPLFTT